MGVIFIPIALTGNGRISLVGGVLELSGSGIAWFLKKLVPLPGGALALTLGHIVLGRDSDALVRTRVHERVHVKQAERLGLLFVPAYLLTSLFLLLRGRDPYRDNPFEKEAFIAELDERRVSNF